ncbi:MAG TPA: T9SS type A sorting domain-containing protein, partial [Bacteroidales bacterium]|nr:T9SS type A sorting domain-containing protein [Bacteroidales bacterium]
EIGNQWYNQSGILPSETSQVYTPLATGDYYTIVTLSGCSSSSSNVISFIYTGIVENNNFASYHIYPNPNNGLFYMEFSIPFTQEIKIEVFNNLGQQVYAISKSYSSGYNIQTIDLSGLAKGVYLIKNNIGGKLNTNKIAVE